MQDILFRTDEAVLSYRVAGICIQTRKARLQKPTTATPFAFPGGHAAFGETNEQTLIREFREELGAEIKVGELKWVGEIFFPWGDRLCHQICLYYIVGMDGSEIPKEGMFLGKEHLENRNFEIEFHWIPLDDVDKITLYPSNCVELMRNINSGVQHFVFKEE